MAHGCVEQLTQRHLSQGIDKDAIEKVIHTMLFLRIVDNDLSDIQT